MFRSMDVVVLLAAATSAHLHIPTTHAPKTNIIDRPSPLDYPLNVPGRCRLPNQFDCDPQSSSSHYCIAFELVRDCIVDCDNAADEQCGINRTLCDIGRSSSIDGGADCGKCIPTALAHSQCVDRKWRNLCTESNSFKCVTNENCVLNEWLNDGDDDCGDESDEGARFLEYNLICLCSDPCLNGFLMCNHGDEMTTTDTPMTLNDLNDNHQQLSDTLSSSMVVADDVQLPVVDRSLELDTSGLLDCADIQHHHPSSLSSGHFVVHGTCCSDQNSLNSQSLCPLIVKCDFDTLGGGWTIIQHRSSATIDFRRNWTEYKHGFGDADDFWIGNDYIHQISGDPHRPLNELMIVMRSAVNNNSEQMIRYSHFQIANEVDFYRLSIGILLTPNTANDMSMSNGRPFGTVDRGEWSGSSNCAQLLQSGWWFSIDCRLDGVLNQPYKGVHDNDQLIGIRWAHDRKSRVQMMIRPIGFRSDFIDKN